MTKYRWHAVVSILITSHAFFHYLTSESDIPLFPLVFFGMITLFLLPDLFFPIARVSQEGLRFRSRGWILGYTSFSWEEIDRIRNIGSPNAESIEFILKSGKRNQFEISAIPRKKRHVLANLVEKALEQPGEIRV